MTMDNIYVLLQHTGCYSDYRCTAIGYVTDEELAKDFCTKAEHFARHLHEKLEKINESEPEEFDEAWYDKSEKKKAKLKSPYDASLDSYEFYDVTYTYNLLEKWKPQ